MTPDGASTPRPPGPLPSAVLAGAGFFFLALAWVPGGPWSPGPGPVPEPRTAVSAVALRGREAPGDRAALARDLLRLGGRGPRLVVLEAWLDHAPAPAPVPKIQDAALRSALQALRPARARRRALKALDAQEQGWALAAAPAPDPLAAALAACPTLLPYVLRPGVQPAGLPPALRREAYAVSLRGRGERLPSESVERLPEPASLAAAAVGLGAVSGERPLAVGGGADLWLNGLGLEAARLARGLPLDALRPRWSKGELSALELGGRGLFLGPGGQARLPADLPDLGARDLDAALAGPVSGGPVPGDLAAKVVFFRPWPLDAASASAFGVQERLYAALAEAPASPPRAPTGRVAWLGAALLAAAVLLALAPLALALPLWAAPLLWAVLELWAWPGLLARVALSAAACLCLGLAGRRLLALRKALALERRFHGRLAPGHWRTWAGLLGRGEAALPAAYAVLGPCALLKGRAFEAWMERWGLFLDPGTFAPDGLGLVLAGPEAEAGLAKALLDARHVLEGVGGALARGTLVFRLEARLGLPHWSVEGAPKRRAWALFRAVEPGRFWLGASDHAAFGPRFETRPAPEHPADPSAEPVFQALGPRVGLWEGPSGG